MPPTAASNMAGGQPPGIGVVARTMVAVRQQAAAGEPVQGAVGERPGGAFLAQRGKHRIVGDAPERQHRTAFRQVFEFAREEGAAGGHFRADGPVLRRDAAHRIDDAAAGGREAVFGMAAIAPPRQAELEQRCEQQVAGIVAGKGPAGPVRAAQAGREADDQDLRAARPESRHRSIEPAGLRFPPTMPERPQARTEGTVRIRLHTALRHRPAPPRNAGSPAGRGASGPLPARPRRA